MNLFGLCGIVIALILLILLVYKGLSPLVAGPLAAILVAVTNGLGAIAGYSEIYMGGLGGFVSNNFPIYLWGAILGELYNVTGAAGSIAHTISKVFRGKNQKAGILTSILIVFVAGVIMSYGGISGIILMFVLMPLTLEIIKEAGIPRYMAPGILLGSIATAALCMPGSPQIQNSAPQTYLGTSSTAALIPGVIGGLLVLTLNVIYLYWSAKKEIAAGHVFQAVEGETYAAAQSQKRPNPVVALLPLVVTFVLYNAFKLYIGYAIMAGIAACFVCFFPQIDGVKTVIDLIGKAALDAAFLVLASGSLAGFGTVVSATDAFVQFSNALTSMNGPALFIAMLAICLITGICGSGPAGIGAALPMFKDTFVAMGINMSALHRIAAFSATTLDTLPTNAGFIAAAGLAKATTKQSYKYVGVCTVLNTTIATLVVTTLLTLFPGLA